MTDWAKKRVTVLGLGKSGLSAAFYLAKRGADVLVSDAKVPGESQQKQIAELESYGVKIEVGGHSDQAVNFGELVVASPGIPPSAEIIGRIKQAGTEIICDIELAFRETRIPIIGITGSNGKSTTCSLVSHILERSGKKAPACGNFGVPILSTLDDNPDYLVVEVSSFQLTYCSGFIPTIGVWLNLTPDHLDWHENLNEYIDAKRKMFENQRADHYAVLNEDDPVVAETDVRAEIFPFASGQQLNHCVQGAWVKDGFLAYRISGRTQLLCAPDELKIRGSHNLENALASVSVAALLGVPAELIESALMDFSALEHRLEYVASIDGIEFYNDSKATNTASSIQALRSFPGRKVVLIAGGRDKGANLDEYVAVVKENAASVILLGEAADRFEIAMGSAGISALHRVDSLEEAVDLGGRLNAGPVVLSPACSSFDMFTNYEERGRVFKDIVRARSEKLAQST